MKSLQNTLLEKLTELMTSRPDSPLSASATPRADAELLCITAARKSAMVSGGAAAIPGVGTTLSLLPDLFASFAIQRRLIADIAALFGQTAVLNPEVMTSLLFGSFAPGAVRGLMTPGAALPTPGWRRIPNLLLQRALRKIAWAIGRRILGRAVERLIPVVGAAGAGWGTYRATMGIGRTSIDFFEERRNALTHGAPIISPAPLSLDL